MKKSYSVITAIAIGVAQFAFSPSTLAQTNSTALSKALECRDIALPDGKPWSDFSASDLPISLATKSNPQIIKSVDESQGEDLNLKTITLKKPEMVFGVLASKVTIYQSIEGKFQLIELISDDFVKLKSDIEKELSISLEGNNNYLSYYNPKTGIEFGFNYSGAVNNKYVFLCGLNFEKHAKSLEKEAEEKQRLVNIEKQKAEQAKLEEDRKQFLTDGMNFLKKGIQERKFYTEEVPIYISLLGALFFILGVTAFFLKSTLEGTLKPKVMNSIIAALGVTSILTFVTAYMQYSHPFYTVGSEKSEALWMKMVPLAVANEKYAKRFMEYGEYLGNNGSKQIADALSKIYKSGMGEIEMNQSKAAKYAAALAVQKDVSENTSNVINEDFTAPPDLTKGYTYYSDNGKDIKFYFVNDKRKIKGDLIRYSEMLEVTEPNGSQSRLIQELEVNCSTRMFRTLAIYKIGNRRLFSEEVSSKWDLPKGSKKTIIDNFCSEL